MQDSLTAISSLESCAISGREMRIEETPGRAVILSPDGEGEGQEADVKESNGRV